MSVVDGTAGNRGTALHCQSRIAYHLLKMEMMASDTITLSVASDTTLGSLIVLKSKSAINTEEGLTLQGKAA